MFINRFSPRNPENQLKNEATQRKSEGKCSREKGKEERVHGKQGEALHRGLASVGSDLFAGRGLCLHEHKAPISD